MTAQRFLLRCLVFMALAAGVSALLVPLAFHPSADEFYGKLTGEPPPSLIIGTSRAAQGLVPSVFNDSTLSFARPDFNFAFTMQHSRYGPAYLRAIQRKLAPGTTDGLFLLEVSPVALSVTAPQAADAEFPESQTFVGKMHSFNATPNLEYALYASPPGTKLMEAIMGQLRGQYSSYLHPDGWLEISLSPRTLADQKRFKFKRLSYENLLMKSRPSSRRWEAFEQTVSFLRERGRVAIVRLPLGLPIYELEQQYQPDFDARMTESAKRLAVPYLNLAVLSGKFETNDGNHLTRQAAVVVSRRVATSLGE